ncbi:MAG TPA: translation initiation factor IF-2 [bacterium]
MSKEEKIRIHTLAKELNVDSKEILTKLKELGSEVKTPSSSISVEVVNQLKAKYYAPKEQKVKTVLRKAKKEEPLPEPEVRVEGAAVQPEAIFQKQPEQKALPQTPVPDTIPQQKSAEMATAGVAFDANAGGMTVIKPHVDEAIKEKKPFRRKIVKRKDEVRAIKDQLVDNVFEEEIIIEEQVKRKKMPPQRPLKKTEITTPKASKKIIKIEDKIVVAELAQTMGARIGDVIRKLIELGTMVTANQTIDADTASLISKEFGYEVERSQFNIEDILRDTKDNPESLKPRHSVVTIMGHVDHGKTTLLDVIRESHVADGEAGGITQHIGAYEVIVNGKKLTFIDTPGHEAFTMMRARGARITDIVVLVVAADDGVMPQTLEAVNHAKAANVPIVVAINKIDKPNVNIHKVKQNLVELGLTPDNWGGNTLYAEISAKKKIGIKELLDIILLQSEMLELKANPDCLTRGTIIESRLEKGRGPVASVIIQKGTLKNGGIIVSGGHFGKVKAMFNFKGERINAAGPSVPVEIIGLSGVPSPGEKLYEVKDEAIAERIAKASVEKAIQLKPQNVKYSLQDLLSQPKSAEKLTLNVIIKADVIGSAEALRDAFTKLSTDKIQCNLIHLGVGGITESDVMLASASKAVIIGFGVREELKAREVSQEAGVQIRFYTIIYDAIEDIKNAMVGMLKPILKEKMIGRAAVKDVFKFAKVGNIAGSLVTEGKIVNGSKIRILRDSIVIYESKIGSLRRFKEDVHDVALGMECGITIENFNDIKAGDILEIFELEEISQTL